ncbi:MAG: tRNA pseudouridine(55) synthase TruB [Pseudomonadota bacterium]
MARKKKGRPISGWLVLDKPYDFGSTQAVGKVKWLFQAQKAGHAGTLDPLASGMLPIALGDATKTVNHVMDGFKTYRFTVRWGVETSTDDAEGEVVNQSDVRPTRQQIEAALAPFIGDILQTPPQFSAVKINGQRAYDLARAGEDVKPKEREVTVDELIILDTSDADHTAFEMVCSKGTYVRSLARDLGRALGTFGSVAALRRTAVEPFDENDLVPLEALIDLEGDLDALDDHLIPLDRALDHLTGFEVSADDARRIRLGNAVLLRGRDVPITEEEVTATHKGQVIALGTIELGRFQPRRLLG